jgi:hypothetical protein
MPRAIISKSLINFQDRAKASDRKQMKPKPNAKAQKLHIPNKYF